MHNQFNWYNYYLLTYSYSIHDIYDIDKQEQSIKEESVQILIKDESKHNNEVIGLIYCKEILE